MKALAHRPADRYESAQALAADIEHWLADEPVGVCREPTSVRCRRWLRKHPGTAASLAATLIVGLLGLGSGLYFVSAEKNRTELARRAAVANEQRADDEKRIAQSVLDFVENKVFAAARPKDQDGGMGYDVQLAAAMKAALKHVETGFPTQPLTEARLRTTLGTSFLYLGNADIAEKQFQRARDLYTAQLGPSDAATLASMNFLASSYAALGRHADALKLFEETLALRQTVLGRDHPDTLTSMNMVANSYAAVGRRADALKLREETYQLMQAKLGADHPGTLAIMNNLATSYAALGRRDDALKLREQSYALRRAKLGPDHPDTLSSRNNLAISYTDAGRHADALKLKEENLAFQKAKLGPDHPDTLRGESNLANTYADLGRFDEAIKLEKETLALKRTKLGRDHPDTLLSMSNLASNYHDAGRYAEALQLGEETLALRQANLGQDHPDTLGSHWGVIGTLIKLKRTDEALTKIDAVLALAASAIAAGKTPHPELVAAMHTFRIGIFRDRQDSAGCRASAEMWEKLQRTDADSLYNAACFRGICAAVMLQQKDISVADQTDRCLQWLKQAIAAGYNDIEQLKKDKDLDAVRDHAEFKKLLAEVEKKRNSDQQ